MIDFDDAVAESTAKPGQKLKVDLVLAEMPPDQSTKAEKWLRDPSVTHRHLARAFAKAGHPVSEGAISNWRRHNDVPVP